MLHFLLPNAALWAEKESSPGAYHKASEGRRERSSREREHSLFQDQEPQGERGSSLSSACLQTHLRMARLLFGSLDKECFPGDREDEENNFVRAKCKAKVLM